MPSDLIAETRDMASATRLLICTSLAYRPERLPELFEMIRSFGDFPVQRLDMIMQVNTEAPEHLDNIEELCGLVRSPSKSFHAEVFIPPADNPYGLCWAHKHHISSTFLAGDYTHFIYLEDDMRFGFLNFCYFLRFRDELDAHGLIPSFARYEWSASSRFLHSTDQTAQTNLSGLASIDGGGFQFFNLDNPYCALFVLDRKLAREYVSSASCDPEASQTVCDFGVPERAAMGLCFDAIPNGFTSRHVVPVSVPNWQVAPFAWIHHLTNTYASDDRPANYFGRIRMDHLLCRDDESASRIAAEGRRTRAHSIRWFKHGDAG